MKNAKIKMQNDNIKFKIGENRVGSPSTTFADFSASSQEEKSGMREIRKHHRALRKSGAGFTLIETFIAISVLLLAVAGPLTIAARSLLSASFARDQITAYYLAQEAVELIRNKRDNNTLSSASSWISGMESCFGTEGCYVDARTEDPVFTPCVTSGCPFLYRSTATGFYSYDTSTGTDQSPFIRSVHMTEISPDEFSVSVTIAWKTGPLFKSFTIQDNFLNWQ